MFIPNLRCRVRRRTGTNVYGKGTYESPKPALFAIVRLEEESSTTSVRTDSSASRGNANENTIAARFLFPISVKLKQGDIVEYLNYRMAVQSVWPRYSVTGTHDHWQVDLVMFKESGAAR